LLHTQTFWALVAAVLGSWADQVTSFSPVMRARLGTLALIVTVPFEVEPSEPSVAAFATPGRATANAAAAKTNFFIVKFPKMAAGARPFRPK